MIERRTMVKEQAVATLDGWVLFRADDGTAYFGGPSGADAADCPVTALFRKEAEAHGKAPGALGRALLAELALAGNHVAALAAIERYFQIVRQEAKEKE